MKLRRFFRYVLMAPFGEEGGGGAPDAPAAADTPSPPAEPVVAPASAAAPAVAATPAPTMLDAINKHFEAPAETAKPPFEAPRNPDGTFVPKTDAERAAAQAKPAELGGLAKPAEPADDLAMPEGLSPKGQERFQKLANTVKEYEGQLDTAKRQIEYVQTTFQSHGIRQEQFEQAANLIGLFNKGDHEAYRSALLQELAQVDLLTGKQSSAPDALANFPDLREAVDGMQITQANALEIARARSQQQQQQVAQQRTQQTQQAQQQEQQAVTAGTRAVDDFCRRMQGSDMDYAAIEAQLLPEIPGLCSGVPPSNWAKVVEANYRMIKKAAGSARASAPAAGSVLRPTGTASPQQAPKTMAEAMWGKPLAA
jgi:hypothetical protein